jgi:hypothetical protein
MKTLIISLLLSMTLPVYSHGPDKNGNHPALSPAEKNLFLQVLKKNDELYNSLLKANQDDVEKSARTLAGLLKKSGAENIGPLSKTLPALDKISGKNSKETNLKAYEEFLPPLIELVKTHKPDSNYQIYYCPMVKKNWIQDQRTNSTVKNVFAQEMLECGGKEG